MVLPEEGTGDQSRPGLGWSIRGYAEGLRRDPAGERSRVARRRGPPGANRSIRKLSNPANPLGILLRPKRPWWVCPKARTDRS